MTAAVAEALNTCSSDFSRDQTFCYTFASWIASHSQADPMETQFVDLTDSMFCQVQHVVEPRSSEVGPTRANASHASGEDGVP